MKINVVKIRNSQPRAVSVPLNLEMHNIRFDHATANRLYFHVVRYPWKHMVDAAADADPGYNIQRRKSFLVVSIQQDRYGLGEVRATFHLGYSAEKQEKTQKGENRRKSVVEKDMLFSVDASPEEIDALAGPMLEQLDAANSKKTAATLRNLYRDAIHHRTLEQLAQSLTPEENEKAARILRAYFANRDGNNTTFEDSALASKFSVFRHYFDE